MIGRGRHQQSGVGSTAVCNAVRDVDATHGLAEGCENESVLAIGWRWCCQHVGLLEAHGCCSVARPVWQHRVWQYGRVHLRCCLKSPYGTQSESRTPAWLASSDTAFPPFSELIATVVGHDRWESGSADQASSGETVWGHTLPLNILFGWHCTVVLELLVTC